MAARFKFGPGVLALAGSRSVPEGSASLVNTALAGLRRPGLRFSVGCCSGFDELALSALPPELVICFAAFGPASPSWSVQRYTAPGAWSGSAVAAVARARLTGVPVRWWSGGGATVPLASRLAGRTAALVQSATSGLLVFPSSPSSPGSFLAARLAAARGLPVVAVPLGFPGSALPPVGPGHWSPLGPSAWLWLSDQVGLPL